MPTEPARELALLRESTFFRRYEELRRMSMCYGMMDSKLSELAARTSSLRSAGPSRWASYGNLETSTMELCQMLSDFLSRMYACKNLSSVCAKRCGVDQQFRELKRASLGFEASLMVNLRNYVVHVDMLPLEIDPRTGRAVFTRRCATDPMWSIEQRRFLRSADLETLLVSYGAMLSSFYAMYFGMLAEASGREMRRCRDEIGELNRRLGYEMVRFDPFAEARCRAVRPYTRARATVINDDGILRTA
ncbi:MAG: hypothetical protein Q4Q58_03550 [Thermoplasmata archaeon]|nr:hypothetical protein [Thermoplasmata archaeon]